MRFSLNSLYTTIIIVNDITYYALMGERLMSFRQTLVNATERKAFETGTTQ